MFEIRGIMANEILRFFLLIAIFEASQAQWRPCVELRRDLHVPCKCSPIPENPRALRMNCDRVVFTRDTLESLRDQPVTWLSQRNSGYQKLPEDLLNSALVLEKLDLSGNSIYRLMDRLLHAQSRLRELRLGDNLLGDNLNPIFSSNEFRDMSELRLLDLNRNGLRSIEEGIFKGCDNLEELYLDDNNLTAVPAESLKGPKAMRVLSLAGNDIGSLPRGAFANLGESLLRIDLSRNELSHMEDGALTGLSHVLFFNLSRNDLTRFNSDVFKGAYNLLQLDLSANFLREFPSDALRHLEALKFLNVSNNLITELERTHLSGLAELQVLDLSRNNIGRLGVNTFANLTALTRLDLSLNALRTIEESSFEGLVNLKWLSLQDNNILLIPALAISRLPSLTHLHVEFNRIAALSSELLRSTASSLLSLGLTRNLVREIPPRLFQNFHNLVNIELSGNMLSSVSENTFAGIENTLLNLDLSNNRLALVNSLQLKSLLSLNLADNNLKRITPDTFENLDKLRYLNISGNPLYGGFPPIFPASLINLDASRTGLKVLPTILLLNLVSLISLALSGNQIQEIGEGTFQHLENLTRVDLSYNTIERIENGAFVGLVNLYELNLRGNRLISFAGEYFNTGTGLEILDLNDNEIAYLSPTSFIIHPRLREIRLSSNRLIRFPSEYIRSLQFLESIDLGKNSLRNVAEFSFSQLGSLRVLILAGNRIETVDDLAFHNSTQLQIIDLSRNILETLSERTLEGLWRLEYLDLSHNRLGTLPETIFDQSRIRAVERIDLSYNRFNEIPVRALQRQSAKLSSLSVASNRLSEVFTQDIVNGVKSLDLSDNPLSDNAIRGIMGEAKILRSLNLARTGMTSITSRLETPFLRYLNLSGNDITEIRPAALERATLLEILDLSSNRLEDFGNLVNTFKTLPALRSLDVSGNLVNNLNESSFAGLERLRELRIANLTECTRIEKSAFRNLEKLRFLDARNYPRLGYFDVQGILRSMTSLESLDIEIKDSTVGNELLSVRTHPRLRELTLRGERLRGILSSALAGIRSTRLYLGLKDSSIDAIPAALLFPVPRSTRIDIDISGSNFTTITGQLIAALDERSGMIGLRGLEDNPLMCDCEIRHLWRWLRISSRERGRIVCAKPDFLAGQVLTDLSEETLSCERATSARLPSTEKITTIMPMRSTSSEPEIIWTAAPTAADDRSKQYHGGGSENVGTSVTAGTTMGTDDTLIIGIVGGVVAFIAIVIIIICICRLRWSNRVNEARMTAMASSIHEASVIRPSSAYSGKINHDAYVGSFNGSTLGHANVHGGQTLPNTPLQMMPYVQPMHMLHQSVHPSQAGNQPIYGYYENGNPSLPMYMTCAPDNKFDR